MPVYKSVDKTADGRQYYFTVSYVGTNNAYKQYKSKKYRTKREAEQAEAEYLVKHGKGKPADMTFNDLIDLYINYKALTVKPQSVKRIEIKTRHIKEHLGNIQVSKLSRQQYETFRAFLANQDYSTNYKNNILEYLKAVLNYGKMNYDVYNKIPFMYGRFIDDKPKAEMQFYTLDQYRQFKSVIDDIRYLALFDTLYYCGLRIGEADALTWHDVDLQGKKISINKTLTTKIKSGGKQWLISTPKTKSSIRILPLPNVALNALKSLKEHYAKYDGFNDDWWVFGGIRPLPESSIQKAKNGYCKKAGLPQIRLHDFRHSTASLLINNGASVALVAKYLGHSDVKVTLNTYTHLWKNKLDELVDALNTIEKV